MLARVCILVVLACSAGCLPAGVFTTARTLEPGQVEHVAFLEVPVAHYENPRPPDDRARALGTPQNLPPTTMLKAGPQLGYALRVGVLRHIEIGGNLSIGTGELNAKIGIVDNRRTALALAPRFATAWTVDGATDAMFYHHLRLPLLFTVEPNAWLSITPRAGLGIVRGHVDSYFSSSDEKSGGTYYVSEPIAEAGLTLLFQVGPTLGLAFEGYGLKSLNDATSLRAVSAVGAGVGLVIGGRGPRR